MSDYAPISTPRGHVLFCDDVRQESTGKLIYIGVYTGGMVLHGEAPAILPTFCIVATYIERPGDTDEPVRIVIETPWDDTGHPFGVIEFPIDFYRNSPIPDDVDDPQRSANIVFRSPGPFVVEKLGTITVYAEVGSKRYRIGRLEITQAPEPIEVEASIQAPETTH